MEENQPLEWPYNNTAQPLLRVAHRRPWLLPAWGEWEKLAPHACPQNPKLVGVSKVRNWQQL